MHFKTTLFFGIIVLLPMFSDAVSMLEGFYCGRDNCYDVLGVTRDTPRGDIAKAYRKLAKKYHPDLFRGEVEKQEAEENFKRVANAYEILKDEESRNDYDYMLDHPEEVYSHYYRYYRRRVAPKVDVRIVITVSITIISVIQYFTSWQRYDSAINYLLTVPKYRNKALEIAKERCLLEDKKKLRGKTKTAIKEETDAILKKVLEENMDIRGGYAKPVITDILWLQLITLPYTTVKYVYWYLRWVWKHNIQNLPLDDEEKLYLIRKYMKKGQTQFDAIEESEKQSYLKLNLWIKPIFDDWLKEKEEEQKKQLAENSRYKAYRRYLKTHGTSRMTFDDS